MSTETSNTSDQLAEQNETQLMAVIDIGATSVRMAIAELNSAGRIRYLENLAQAVSLGKDSFIKGYIERGTIEDCVAVLRIYRQKLDEYGIRSPDKIRVVATSAVREAANQMAFQDRVYIATGFEIEPFDEAELHRVTFLGIQPFLDCDPTLKSGQTVVYEIGGGSTEMLVLREGTVEFARTFRLGSLRLRKTLEAYQTPLAHARTIMESQIDQTVKQIHPWIAGDCPTKMVAMGGDIRLAATATFGKDPEDELVPIRLDSLEAFIDEVFGQTPERLVNKFNLSLPEAESLGPALLAHLMLARGLQADPLLVAKANLRDGLIKEMVFGRIWTKSIEDQIISSAIQLGRKCKFDEKHARQVARLATALFGQLSELHGLRARYETILRVSALLHEVGLFVGSRGYHKHSMYIIRNAEFFGIGAKDLLLVALVARYHRRAEPQARHEGYSSLNRRDRVAVSKLAAILRIAIALDASRSQLIGDIHCQAVGKKVIIETDCAADLSMEQLELRQAMGLFDDVFGMRVALQQNGA